MNDFWLGIDIGGTKCAVILARVDKEIRILDKIRFPTENGFENVYKRLCEVIDSIFDRHAEAEKQTRAIGISCGGPLDSRRGIILCPPNLQGWKNIPLPHMLEEKYKIPAYIQNDANACALVEWKIGAGRGTQDMIFVTMGTGLGGGVIAEGRLIRGATDMGGEIGHLRLTDDGPVGFGKAGSFEGWCSGGGMARQAKKLSEDMINDGTVPPWIADGYPLESIDAAVMAEYARKGDHTAKDFFIRTGRMLGKGLSVLVDAFNPEMIVIGSIFVRCEDILREAMEEELRRECIPFSYAGLKVVPAETGESIGDYAAILTALYGYNAMGLLSQKGENNGLSDTINESLSATF